MDGLAQAELVRRNEVTPLELLGAAIQRIEAVNPSLNAVVATMYEEAETVATSGSLHGAFAGVPFLLKDGGGAAYAGFGASGGSRFLADYIAPEDGLITKRFKAAGLVVCGRTNLPEFGALPTTEPEVHGPTMNPWDTERMAGGSSGGAAAAVASRMVPMANGSDVGGSIRVPAACCGVFGLKPTRMRISSPRRDLGVSLRMAMLSEHALTVSVRDSAALLDATAGPEQGDPFVAPAPSRPYLDEVGADPGRLRIAFSTVTPSGSPLHPDCVAAVEDAAALCEELGHHVEQDSPRLDIGSLAESFGLIATVGTAWDIRNWERKLGKVARPEDFEPATWATIERGRSAGATAEDLMDAEMALQGLCDQLAAWSAPFDVWLTPTTGSPALPLGSFSPTDDEPMRSMRTSMQFLPFTMLQNLSGQPAMSVPLYWNDDGLPVGVQFAGGYGNEGLLFRLAAQLEAARPWTDRVPPISAVGL
ncbi:amidase [Actinospongicola halichondriae]|uniref:amidase n=1 Tax=Actinospongicola halichondriae TaxID=3236844 RepID=UPI003D3B9DEC